MPQMHKFDVLVEPAPAGAFPNECTVISTDNPSFEDAAAAAGQFDPAPLVWTQVKPGIWESAPAEENYAAVFSIIRWQPLE